VEGVSVYGITFPLITTASGAKMGKTAAGAVWLDRSLTSPYDYYQFWINTDDRDVERFLALFTLLDMEVVRALGGLKGAEIREGKKRLAYEATALAHGKKEAEKAAEAAQSLFGAEGTGGGDSGGDCQSHVPSAEIPSAELAEGVEAFDLFHRAGLTKSRGESRRLIEGGGAYVNGKKVAVFNDLITLDAAGDGAILLRAGKKKYCRVIPA
jgi:tyrosyl-tRNA synthetase